ncbi:MAG: peptidoglycan DD-metalloendopeptidase family protein [Bacteroidetes bacterium]|nr:peptidoglycan DD-metalloendopeptidase family protein [Bacteroidota bacterium]
MLSIEDDTTGITSHQWCTTQCFIHQLVPDSIHDTTVTLTSTDKPFVLPRYGRLFRGFTYVHKGLDIGLKRGDTVEAAFNGVVRYAKYNHGGFGNLVIIRHFNGLETYYAHLSKIKVQEYQIVKAGELIGLGGSTGRSRAPHLHFEVRYMDTPLDPQKIIDYENQKLITNTFCITKSAFYPADYDGTAVIYKIKPGDTLGRIAKRYKTSIKAICAMNKIRNTGRLRIGTPIRVR